MKLECKNSNKSYLIKIHLNPSSSITAVGGVVIITAGGQSDTAGYTGPKLRRGNDYEIVDVTEVYGTLNLFKG